MSLTSLLDQKDVKERFRQEFPKPKFTRQVALLAEPRTKNYSIVGSAFDYLLRFYIERHYPAAITKSWVAQNALQIIIDQAEGRNDYELLEKAEKLFADAKQNHKIYLDTGFWSDCLLASAVGLAQLDAVFRAGERVYDSVFPWIKSGRVDDRDIEDLKNLVRHIPPELLRANNGCLLNPTFNHASNLVGGADADLIIDDCIIDIKTTKNFRLEQAYFHQIIGYYLLYRIGGITGIAKSHEITHVAIYFSRHAYLLKIPIRNLVNEETFPGFLNWFVERAKSEFGLMIEKHENIIIDALHPEC